jgi:uncharacterized protein (TIRG00374 family)
VVVAVSLAVFLLHSAGLESLLKTFAGIDVLWALAAAGLSVLLVVIGSFNLWLLLQPVHRFPFLRFIKSYSYSFAIALFAPGQLGDASLTLFLKKQGIPFSRSGVAYMLDKTITLIVLMLVASYGSQIFLPKVYSAWFLVLPIGGVLLVVMSVLLIFYMPLRSRFLKRLKQLMRETLENSQIYRKKRSVILLNVSLTVVKWLVLSCNYFLAFWAFGTWVKWPEVGVIPILSTLVGYIPVSVAGIGTVEYSAVYLFGSMGISKSTILSVYIFLRSVNYLIAGCMLLLFGTRRGHKLTDVADKSGTG